MNVKNLNPDFLHSDPATGFQVILRNLFMRTNFVPGVRYVIGWRGVKDSSFDVEGWSAKINGFKGVFGIYFDSARTDREWDRGRFILNYFPDPEEELVDSFSIQAGFQTQQNDYYRKVRKFLEYPELCELFNIGIINLGITKNENMFYCGLESFSQQRITAQDGVMLQGENEMVELVNPGGCDQDLPSYRIAFEFFKVLAASVTFNIEDTPKHLSFVSKPGSEIVYTSAGDSWEKKCDDLKKEFLSITYSTGDVGRSDLTDIIPEISDEKQVHWFHGNEIPLEYSEELWWKSDKISSYNTVDKKILGIDERPELIVVTGFLGSGKTSFLQNFIEYQVGMNRFVAVIQNEIGEVGLDGKLLDQDFAVTEIDEGCICCTLVGNLKSAITGILSEFHPDYIILETTGLANPYNLLDELGELSELVRFDSVTTIVDALNIEESCHDYEVAQNQVKAADILLLNKKDLLSEKQLISVEKKLRELNPAAPVIYTSHGDINPALIYGDGAGREKEISNIREGSECMICPGHDHEHHSHQHDALSSIKIEINKPVNQRKFFQDLENLSDKVFRVKGVVDFEDRDTPVLVQFVAGRYEISEYTNAQYDERFLIVIGQNLEQEFSPVMFLA